jgi:hypothetical protein
LTLSGSTTGKQQDQNGVFTNLHSQSAERGGGGGGGGGGGKVEVNSGTKVVYANHKRRMTHHKDNH